MYHTRRVQRTLLIQDISRSAIDRVIPGPLDRAAAAQSSPDIVDTPKRAIGTNILSNGCSALVGISWTIYPAKNNWHPDELWGRPDALTEQHAIVPQLNRALNDDYRWGGVNPISIGVIAGEPPHGMIDGRPKQKSKDE